MQVSYTPDVVDDEVMSEVSQPSPQKIVIGRRRPVLPPSHSVVGSNVNLLSGLSGSCSGSIKNSLPGGLVAKAMARMGATATPNKGPGRFVSVNLNKHRGAAEVAKQTKMVMKNLRNFQDGAKLSNRSGLELTPPRSFSQAINKENMQGYTRVRSKSPDRLKGRLPLSPVKNHKPLNKIRQELSPSPVENIVVREVFNNTVDTEFMVDPGQDVVTSTSAKAYVSIARIDMAEHARKKEVNKENKKKADDYAEEANDGVLMKNLPRPSDSFQPTPARFATRNVRATRNEVIEIEEVTENELTNVQVEKLMKRPFMPGVSRPSEADLGFAPPSKVPSLCSEVTFNFKKPSGSVSKVMSGTKRKEAPVDSDSLQEECRYLQSWIPRLRNKRLYVEGDLLDLDSDNLKVGSDQRWVTSKIVTRVANNRVATKKGTVYVLEGQLVVRNFEGDKLVEDGPTPNFIIDKFKDGFPENWQRLISHWIKFNDQNNINNVNMSVFNSTSMTNMSMNNMTALFNISSISANTSRFLPSRGRLTNTSQLTFNKGANLSILPEEEQNKDRPTFEVIDSSSKVSRIRSMNSVGGEQRSRSPKNDKNPVDKPGQASPGHPQTKHRSRSKTVRHNKNSVRSQVLKEKSPVANIMEITMSQHDFTLLRAKSYDHTVMVNKKKNYNCHFCIYLTPLFNSLKIHIKKNHLDERVISSPTHSLTAPRSQSDESVWAASTSAKQKPRRSSFSLSKLERANLDNKNSSQVSLEEQLVMVSKSKNSFHCDQCNLTTKYRSAMVAHIKSKKHMERVANFRSRSRKSSDESKSKVIKSISPRGRAKKLTSPSKGEQSKSPTIKFHKSRSKSGKSQISPLHSILRGQPIGINELNSPQSRKAKSKIRSTSPKSPIYLSKKRLSRTPGIGMYVCFACDCSSDDDVEMFTHLMSSMHSKKVKTCKEMKFLNCNMCMVSTNKKDDLIKHMRSKRHVKSLTSTKSKDEGFLKSTEKQGKDINKQSRFGRTIKKTKALSRESCVYGTPEEIDMSSKKPRREVPNAMKARHCRKSNSCFESPRRTVLNPFKRAESSQGLIPHKPVKSTEDIFEKISANPKTVKQRQQNAEALKEYNENHEDDIFGGPIQSKSKPTLLKPSTKTLLSQDSDSDSEQDISVHSARTPMTCYFGKSGLSTTTPMHNQDKTPGILFQDSPLVPVNGEGYQAQAYIHKKVAEKAKYARKIKKHKLATALVSNVVSRTHADKRVDQSSQVITTVTNYTVSMRDDAEEGDEADDWFDDDQETNLSCDPGAGLLELLAKH